MMNDELEQAFREGYKKGYERACKDAVDRALRQYPNLKTLMSENFTDNKTANDLMYNCEGLMKVGVHPDIGALRYIKLSIFEAILRGESGVCND